jgi:hypothetical protein
MSRFSRITMTAALTSLALVSAAGAQTMRASCDNRQGTTFADVVDSSDPTQGGYNIDPSEIYRSFNSISFPVSQTVGANTSSANLTLNSRFLGANPGTRITGFLSEASGQAIASRSNTNTQARTQNIINVCMDLSGASVSTPSLWRYVGNVNVTGSTGFSRLVAPSGSNILNITTGSINRVVRLTTNGQYQVRAEFDSGMISQNTAGTTTRSATVRGSLVCIADFNASGSITSQDIFDFLGAWFGGDLAADCNTSNTITVQDVFDFLNVWFTGCV